MKRKTKLLILFILCAVFLCTLAALSACKKEEGEKTPETDATFIEITPLRVVLDLYEQETLTATVRKGAEYLFEEVSWSSADPSVAEVSAEGVVSAVSEGETKVIAKYQTYEASCDVVVSLSGAKANLALADYEIGMRVDETKRISPVVRYKGKTYNDADFTYTVEDKTVAAVSSSGVIEALKYGVTKVTVSASWRGVTGEDAELLTKELTIDVKDNIYASIEDNSYVVYQADTEIEGVKFSNTAEVAYSLTWAGEDITGNDGLTWYSENEEILRAEDGVIYGVSAGTAQIWFTYTSDKGDTYESNRVTVNVVYPILDKTDTLTFTIDKDTVLTGEEVFGQDVAIESIGCDGVTVSTDNPGMIDFDKMENGEHVIIVYNEGYGYQVGAYICTKVIRTVEDLMALQYKGTNIGGGNLYALGNDIDAKGAVFQNAAVGWNQNQGFQGEIDGRGYKVYDFSVGMCGIFGTLGKANIHDIRFEGVTLLARKRTALLAATCYNTTLENITVVYKQIGIPTDAASGATDECGLLVARQINTAVTMRNITLNAPGLTVPCVLGYEVGEVVFINVVVNAGEVLSLGSAQQWSPTATQLEDVSGVTVNEGVTALQSAPALPAKKYVF